MVIGDHVAYIILHSKSQSASYSSLRQQHTIIGVSTYPDEARACALWYLQHVQRKGVSPAPSAMHAQIEGSMHDSPCEPFRADLDDKLVMYTTLGLLRLKMLTVALSSSVRGTLADAASGVANWSACVHQAALAITYALSWQWGAQGHTKVQARALSRQHARCRAGVAESRRQLANPSGLPRDLTCCLQNLCSELLSHCHCMPFMDAPT